MGYPVRTVMTVAMVVAVNADTNSHATDVYAYTDARVGHANAEQRNHKNRGDNGFHEIGFQFERHYHFEVEDQR